MCEFCDANSKGEILSGKPVRTFEWQKTAGYKAPKKRNDFLEMFILKLKNDKKAGLMVDNGYGCRYVDIDYCMFCRKEARRVKHITLKEMFEILIDCIINQKEQPTFYYKRENEYIIIQEVDLMDSRFRTTDGDFSEYEWELEKSTIYVEE